MNCKPGDLAIVVRSYSGSVGMVCTCLERYDGPWSLPSGEIDHFEPGWKVDRVLKSGRPYIVDSALRPIRPQDGEDETLTWAGKPEQVTA